MISIQVGDCWVWSLIIFLISEVLFHLYLDFRPKWGDVGRISPPLLSQGGLGRVVTINGATLAGVQGKHPRKEFILEKCLVKYFNFVVNLDHSLCHRYGGINFVNLVFFPLEGNTLLYTRELYYYFLREETMKE